MIKISNQPTSAIGKELPVVEFSGLEINEVGLNNYKVQLSIFPEHQEKVSQKMEKACRLKLPAFGEKNEDDKVKILAIAPSKWLIISQEKLNWLEQVVDNKKSFVNEQSSAYSLIEIKGNNTAALMQQLSFIDWRVAKPVVLTQLAGDYYGLVERLGDLPSQGYHLYIARSMAKSFWERVNLIAK